MHGINLTREAIGFVLFLLLGAGTITLAIGYDIGTPGNIGPGFFPFVLGCLLVALAVANLIAAFVSGQEIVEEHTVAAGSIWARFKFALIPISLVIFALLLMPLGMFVASIISIMVASVADEKFRPLSSFVLGVVVATMCVLVFGVALGLPIPVLPQWFR